MWSTHVPSASKKRCITYAQAMRLLALPDDVLFCIVNVLLRSRSSSTLCATISERLLNADDNSSFLSLLSFASTCKSAFWIVKQSLTSVRLKSSWRTHHNVLTAACKIAGPCLKSVHLECSAPVTPALRQIIAHCPNVTTLVLNGVNISQDVMHTLVNTLASTIRVLAINASQGMDSDTVRKIARRCVNLTHIELGGSRKVDIDCLHQLWKMRGNNLKLIELTSLTHSSLTSAALVDIATHCTQLEEIRLVRLRWVTDDALRRLVTKAGLRICCFQLVACERVSESVLHFLTTFCRSLKSVAVHTENDLSNTSIINLCAHIGAQLKSLCIPNLANDIETGDHILEGIARSCFELTSIQIPGTMCSDAGLAKLLQATGPRLTTLVLRHCSNLSNATLQILGTHNRNIERLDISYLTKVTNDGIDDVMRGLGRALIEFDMIGCQQISDDAITSVIRHCRCIRLLRLSYAYVTRGALIQLREPFPDLVTSSITWTTGRSDFGA